MQNTNDWLEIKLETTENYDSDNLEEALFAAGALSVTLTSKADEVILIEPSPGELPLWEQGIIVTGLFDKGSKLNDALSVIKACLNTQTPPLVATENLADRQWELEWTQYFHPMLFGKHLWICPSNQSVPANEMTEKTRIITLDPGLAFGTGTHPTTAMALTDIATYNVTGKQVIDFGCGSGVLGIAALKMGAKHVIMTDIDPQALTTTQENAKINAVSEYINCYLPDDMPVVKTDFIIANILLEPLLMLKDTFVKHCHADTRILLTGLLKTQVRQIIAQYESDFINFEIIESGDWVMIVAQRKA